MTRAVTVVLVCAFLVFLATMLFQNRPRPALARQNTALYWGARTVRELDTASKKQPVWPVSTPDAALSFKTSTEYWRYLMTNHVLLREDYSCFAAGSMAPYLGSKPEEFSQSNNAWCIVLDVGPEYPTNAPVMFTRNLEIRDVGGDGGRLEERDLLREDWAVVIYRNGTAKVLPPRKMASELNPTPATNAVLRPWTDGSTVFWCLPAATHTDGIGTAIRFQSHTGGRRVFRADESHRRSPLDSILPPVGASSRREPGADPVMPDMRTGAAAGDKR